MKAVSSFVLAVAVGLLVIGITAPVLTALAGALVPLVVVATVAAIALRLVFVHTRRW